MVFVPALNSEGGSVLCCLAIHAVSRRVPATAAVIGAGVSFNAQGYSPNAFQVCRQTQWQQLRFIAPGCMQAVVSQPPLPTSVFAGRLMQPVSRLLPNPSLKRSTAGRAPGPVWRYAVHCRQPGPGTLPPLPA